MDDSSCIGSQPPQFLHQPLTLQPCQYPVWNALCLGLPCVDNLYNCILSFEVCLTGITCYKYMILYVIFYISNTY